MSSLYVRMIIFFLFIFSCSLNGQDLDSLLNLNAFTEESELQKILNKNITVSSQKALTTRETPGIISLITAEEIENSGARDLADILRLVPGFEVMQDLQFVMGIGLRGNWANEGKVLVMIDGQPLNEILYQTVAIGNRFAVDAIERIEIIRGPGSAIYGGSAEYGVINIITKAAESLNGVAIYGTAGLHSNATGRTTGGIMASQKHENMSWDVSVFGGKGIVSNQSYQELGGTDILDLSQISSADPFNINAGFKFKNLSFRTMYDQFETSDPYYFVSYKNFYADLKYAWKANDRWTITPHVKYYNQLPWAYGNAETGEHDFDVRATRILAQADVLGDVTKRINVNFGGLYFVDRGDYMIVLDSFDGERDITLKNYAFYAQALFRHRLFNATAGFRFEKNNRYDGAFVPRLAITKKIQNFHFKILYSESFRAPSIQNINIHVTENAKPERSNVFEFECGYQFTPEMLLAVNVFSILTRDVLIYGTEGEGEALEEWYENFNKSGSKGIELVYSIRKKNWYTTLTHSFSQAIKENTVETYAIPGNTKQYVGFPLHKTTLNTNVSLTPQISFNSSFIFASKRYAYTELDEEDEPVISELSPYLLANTFVNYRNFLTTGMMVGIGVYDIANQRPAIPQAYNGGYGPIPGRGREYVIKISYQINFKK